MSTLSERGQWTETELVWKFDDGTVELSDGEKCLDDEREYFDERYPILHPRLVRITRTITETEEQIEPE